MKVMTNLIKNELYKLGLKVENIAAGVGIVVVQFVTLFVVRPWEPLKSRFGNAIEFSNFNLTITMSILTIYLIVTLSIMISDDFKNGTIKQVLIRPHHRWQILLSKYLTTLLILIGVVFTILIVTLSIGVVIFGTHGGDSGLTLIMLLKIALYEMIKAIFYITLAFMLTSFMEGSIAPILITVILYMAGNYVVLIGSLVMKDYADFFIFKHVTPRVLDPEILIHEGKSTFIHSVSLINSMAYLVAHLVAMIGTSLLYFEKKDIF